MRFLVIDADAAFDGDRNRGGSAHSRDAAVREIRRAHQHSAEAAGLNAPGWTTGIQIDLIIAPFTGDACCFCEFSWICATQLQGDRMFNAGKSEQAFAIAMQHRIGGNHLRIKAGAFAQQPVQDAAVPVRPVHHRCNAEQSADVHSRFREVHAAHNPSHLR